MQRPHPRLQRCAVERGCERIPVRAQHDPLATVLAENLPWAQQLGTPEPSRHQQTTARQRAERYLATTASTQHAHYTEAAQLLQRRDQLLDHYRDLTHDINEGRDLTRSHGRDHGLEL